MSICWLCSQSTSESFLAGSCSELGLMAFIYHTNSNKWSKTVPYSFHTVGFWDPKINTVKPTNQILTIDTINPSVWEHALRMAVYIMPTVTHSSIWYYWINALNLHQIQSTTMAYIFKEHKLPFLSWWAYTLQLDQYSGKLHAVVNLWLEDGCCQHTYSE